MKRYLLQNIFKIWDNLHYSQENACLWFYVMTFDDLIQLKVGLADATICHAEFRQHSVNGLLGAGTSELFSLCEMSCVISK
jgi:hypothetical protein